MAIPDFQSFMLPLLKIVRDGQEHSVGECQGALAEQFGLSEEEVKELLPSGRQTRFRNRIGWALTHLRKAGLFPLRGLTPTTLRRRKRRVPAAANSKAPAKTRGCRDEPGIYAALGLRAGGEPVVLDVGESGWAYPEGQELRMRLKKHGRKACWKRHFKDESIGFAVLYEKSGKARLLLEKVLRETFRPPCGTDVFE